MFDIRTATVIVRDDGFAEPDARIRHQPAATLVAGTAPAATHGRLAVDLSPGEPLEPLAPFLDRISLIRVAFDHFADGRGFTVARRLRAMGYAGRLRAAGHVLADQYAMARRAGFDEVEIAADLAARQPEADWLARAEWRRGDYRARLTG